jgi:transcription elongation factor GreA
MADVPLGIDASRKAIEDELRKLNEELRVELPREIDRARQLGDLSENAEYQTALQRQSYVKARVSQLGQRVAALAKIDTSAIPKDRAAYGSILKLLDLDREEEMEIRLVTREESDAQKGWYSVQSPVGKALLGSRKGDEVTVDTPGGRRSFEVLSLKTIHEQ